MNLAYVAEVLNRVPFVAWDRLTRYEQDDVEFLDVYGWVPRDDGRSDFLIVEFEQTADETVPRFGNTTSSYTYDRQIERLLHPDDEPAEPHVGCEPIERVVAGVRNFVVRDTLAA